MRIANYQNKAAAKTHGEQYIIYQSKQQQQQQHCQHHKITRLERKSARYRQTFFVTIASRSSRARSSHMAISYHPQQQLFLPLCSYSPPTKRIFHLKVERVLIDSTSSKYRNKTSTHASLLTTVSHSLKKLPNLTCSY